MCQTIFPLTRMTHIKIWDTVFIFETLAVIIKAVSARGYTFFPRKEKKEMSRCCCQLYGGVVTIHVVSNLQLAVVFVVVAKSKRQNPSRDRLKNSRGLSLYRQPFEKCRHVTRFLRNKMLDDSSVVFFLNFFQKYFYVTHISSSSSSSSFSYFFLFLLFKRKYCIF